MQSERLALQQKSNVSAQDFAESEKIGWKPKNFGAFDISQITSPKSSAINDTILLGIGGKPEYFTSYEI